jgi:hypothetical protein
MAEQKTKESEQEAPETPDSPENQEKQTVDDSDERPKMDMGEMAEQIESQSDPMESEAPDSTGEMDGMGGMGGTDSGAPSNDDLPDGVTFGDMYCNGLCIFSNEVAKHFGSGDEIFEVDNDGKIDTSMAKQLELDVYINQVLQKRGQSNMSPEQALLLATVTFIGMVLVQDSEIVGNIFDQINDKTGN